MRNSTLALGRRRIVLDVGPIGYHREVERVAHQRPAGVPHRGKGIVVEFLIWREWPLSHPVQIEEAVECHVHGEDDLPHAVCSSAIMGGSSGGEPNDLLHVTSTCSPTLVSKRSQTVLLSRSPPASGPRLHHLSHQGRRG